MFDTLIFLLLILAVIIIVWLLKNKFLSEGPQQSLKTKKVLKKQKTENGGTDYVRCPLCNTPMAQDEDMISRIFRPMKNGQDQRMTVLGCPHCYPRPENGVHRICPVCKKNVPMDGYLIARLFNRSGTKKHVMITGCTQCYGPQK